jgi:hypothetical protein
MEMKDSSLLHNFDPIGVKEPGNIEKSTHDFSLRLIYFLAVNLLVLFASYSVS